jgi:hypothetical protein
VRYSVVFLCLILFGLFVPNLQEGIYAAALRNCKAPVKLDTNLLEHAQDCWGASRIAAIEGEEPLFERTRSFELGALGPQIDAQALQLSLNADLDGVQIDLLALSETGEVLDRQIVGSHETSQIKLHKRMGQFGDGANVVAAREELVELGARERSLKADIPAGTRSLELRLSSLADSFDTSVSAASLEISQTSTHTVYLPTVRTPIRRVDGNIAQLVPLLYYLESDSSGTKPAPNTDITLSFGPDGKAQLYASQEADGLGYLGAFSYNQGQLSLQFDHADFKRKLQVSLDPQQATITLPFQVFSDDPGSSTWKRRAPEIEHSLAQIFYGMMMGEGATIDEALARANDYAQARVALAVTQAQAQIQQNQEGEFVLIRAEALENGVRLYYRVAAGPNGETMEINFDVQLFGWLQPRDGELLTTSVLAADPRVHLDPLPPLNANDDPANKTALLIAPFYNSRMLVGEPGKEASIGYGTRTWAPLSQQEADLSASGYTVKTLYDEKASVEGLLTALKQKPGLVFMMTHGNDQGSLGLGTFLGNERAEFVKNFRAVLDTLKKAGYPSLGECKRWTVENCALGIMGVRNDMRPNATSVFLSINPSFWTWSRAQGASFDDSLVIIAACLTDSTPTLRNAIRAEAYLASDVVINADIAGTFFEYFVRALDRRTRSVEEVYYNMLRVANTRQMIYEEDKLLNKQTTWVYKGQTRSIALHVHGHFYDPASKKVLPYRSNGWLDTKSNINQGALWWLLFSARWSQDTKTGLANLERCWSSYWSKGEKAPPLGDPDCHNRQQGSRVPTADEYAYARYLYAGEQPAQFSRTAAARWTLHDGRE